MKTGNCVKDRKNSSIFTYNNVTYTYDTIFQLIKDLEYHKTGEDCDWNIIRVHDIKTDKDCYCVVFQETDSASDWFHNFNFFPESTKAYKGWKNHLVYHKGFFDEYQSARDEIRKYLSPLLQDLSKEQSCPIPELRLYVTGWSLGGGISQIAMEDFYETYGIKPIMITYEAPNPSENCHTKKYLTSCLHEESILFVYSNDIVCRCPPFCGKILNDYVYYIDDKKCKFPFYLIKKLISFICDTRYYHTHIDDGIRKYMPTE